MRNEPDRKQIKTESRLLLSGATGTISSLHLHLVVLEDAGNVVIMLFVVARTLVVDD